MLSITTNLVASLLHFPLKAKDIAVSAKRVGEQYRVEGASYKIFRETVYGKETGEPEVLIVGFRLRLIGGNMLLHRIFQHICIVTTPFWAGLSGFRIKLWMVDPRSCNYLGIYDWRGIRQSRDYIDYLLPILRLFSVRGSVWYKIIRGQEFEAYLAGIHDLRPSLYG